MATIMVEINSLNDTCHYCKFKKWSVKLDRFICKLFKAIWIGNEPRTHKRCEECLAAEVKQDEWRGNVLHTAMNQDGGINYYKGD